MKHLYFIVTILIMCLLLFSPHEIHAAEKTIYYNVMDYGANGKDTDTDTAAIQKVLDQSSEYHKIIVYIPSGTYYLTKPLFIQSNTTLRLSKNTIIKRSRCALSKNMLRTTDSEHDSDFDGEYQLAHDITIEGGVWDGGYIQGAKKGCNLIYIGHSSNVTIKNTTIRNCFGAHAIEFAGVKESRIKYCTITGFRYEKDHFTSEAIQLDTCYKSKKEGKWAPGFYADKTPCKDITISHNTIIDYPRGIGVHHNLKGHQNRNITICYNQFRCSSADKQYKAVSGIFLMGVKDAAIYKNQFDNYSYGVFLKNSTDVAVRCNIFNHNRTEAFFATNCSSYNGHHTFRLKLDKEDPAVLEFLCDGIKVGNVKIGKKRYNFRKNGSKVHIKLKKDLKPKQKIEFYGKDICKNKYYQTFKVPEHFFQETEIE